MVDKNKTIHAYQPHHENRLGIWLMGFILSAMQTNIRAHHHLKLGTEYNFNTMRMGDADLRFYITTVQDG